MRRRRAGALCDALVGWRGDEMILKTSQATARVRQGVGDASATRRFGISSVRVELRGMDGQVRK